MRTLRSFIHYTPYGVTATGTLNKLPKMYITFLISDETSYNLSYATGCFSFLF